MKDRAGGGNAPWQFIDFLFIKKSKRRMERVAEKKSTLSLASR